MDTQKVELPVDLVNAIIGYLVKQPFEQVAHLIHAIHQRGDGEPRAVPPPPPSK